MNESRRDFLPKAGLSLTPLLLNNFSGFATDPKHHQDIKKFGIQLWTVQDAMAKDPKGTLAALSKYGYRQIESFTGKNGIFWGMKPSEFKKVTHDLGLETISSHVNPAFFTDKSKEDEFKKLTEEAASVGIKYMLNPFPGELKSTEEWKTLADGLNRCGAISKLSGVTSGYHNHHFEFLPTAEGDIPEEILLKNTDPNLVAFELDLYWNVKAGQDPEKWFTANKNRYKLVHIKDWFKAERVAEIESTEKSESTFWPLGESTVLGNGRIDFAKILKSGRDNGVKYFIVEQERFDNSTPMQDAKKDAGYMKKV